MSFVSQLFVTHKPKQEMPDQWLDHGIAGAHLWRQMPGATVKTMGEVADLRATQLNELFALNIGADVLLIPLRAGFRDSVEVPGGIVLAARSTKVMEKAQRVLKSCLPEYRQQYTAVLDKLNAA
ncbi:MAG: hypothetical protein AB7G06_03225 [Bdellovibrionales bacterium]